MYFPDTPELKIPIAQTVNRTQSGIRDSELSALSSCRADFAFMKIIVKQNDAIADSIITARSYKQNPHNSFEKTDETKKHPLETEDNNTGDLTLKLRLINEKRSILQKTVAI